MQIATTGTADELVLDFFGGSGTTAHAVYSTNASGSGDRRFILVQLPEATESNKYSTIADVTKERLRRAGAKVKADNPLFAGDTGFRVFKLDSSNIRAWQPTGDLAQDLVDNMQHLQAERTDNDVLYELLLKLGLDLCVPIEVRAIAGKTVHNIGAGVLLACLDAHIGVAQAEALALGMAAWHKELAPAGDSTAVFRDSAFENDVAKSNLAAILEQYGIKQVRSL